MSNPSSSILLTKFDVFCYTKKVSDSDVEKHAKQFFTWCCIKGYDQCPFPEYLTKFVLGQWSPND